MSPPRRHPSLQSRLLEFYLRLQGRKRLDHRLRERIAQGWRPRHARPPRRLFHDHFLAQREVFGCRVWTLAPAVPPPAPARPLHLLFLHGGAYVNGLVPAYWTFLETLVDRLHCTVVIPEYPLAPAHHAGEVHSLVLTLYREIGAACDGHGVAVMGASSGGGLALALAQELHGLGIPEPSRLVLISPWLDVTMRNPALVDANRLDPLLDLEGLRDAGRLYAGPRATDDPVVSPIYGPLDGLPPLTVLVGTHDVLLPDIRRFRDMACSAGARVDYHEFPGMVHEWTLHRLPEAREAMDLMCAALAAIPSPD